MSYCSDTSKSSLLFFGDVRELLFHLSRIEGTPFCQSQLSCLVAGCLHVGKKKEAPRASKRIISEYGSAFGSVTECGRLSLSRYLFYNRSYQSMCTHLQTHELKHMGIYTHITHICR